MDYLTKLEEHLRLFYLSRDGTKLSNPKFLRCYVKLFPREGSYENPRSNQVVGICLRNPTVTSIRREQL
jgi:hypothetical protein